MRKLNITGLTILVFPIAFLIWTAFVPIEASKQSSKHNKSPSQKDVLKEQSDISWKDLSEDKLQEFVSFFEGKNKQRTINSNFETLVEIGETVVTEGYTVQAGEFVFATLTPNLAKLTDGSTIVRVEAKTMMITISGGYETLFNHTFDVVPKRSYGFFELRDGLMHSLDVSAEQDEFSPSIRMSASVEAAKW